MSRPRPWEASNLPNQTDYSGLSSSLSNDEGRWQFSLASILRGMVICGIVCAIARWLVSESHGTSWMVHVAGVFYPLATPFFCLALPVAPLCLVALEFFLVRKPHGIWTGWLYFGSAAIALWILFWTGGEDRMFRALDVLALSNACMWIEAWIRRTILERAVILGLATVATLSYGCVITAIAVWASC